MNTEAIKVINLMPKATSGSDEWQQWHIQLKKRFGKKSANMIFVKAWEARAGKNSAASSDELRAYMRDQGVDLDTTVLQDVIDSTSGITDFFGDVIKAGAITGYAITGIVVVGLAMLVFNIAKQPLEAAKIASNFMPGK